MQPQSLAGATSRASERHRAALITLLADDDPAVYQTVRRTILSSDLAAGNWLRPYALSSDPVLRRRAREILRHLARQQADVRFLGFCLQNGEEFDLEQAAWLLTVTVDPEISVAGYGALLDEYAAELRGRIGVLTRAGAVLGTINQYLFGELGFRGHEGHESELEGCYLNRVMDRRAGDPYSLCLLYVLLARRLRLPVAGIALPGYFICRYQSSADEVYVDVFHRGRLLTKADCIQCLYRRSHDLPADFLAPVSARRFFLRICDNLHQVYLRLGFTGEAIRVQRYLVALKGS